MNCDKCVRLSRSQNGAISETEKRNPHKRAQYGDKLISCIFYLHLCSKALNNAHGRIEFSFAANLQPEQTIDLVISSSVRVVLLFSGEIDYEAQNNVNTTAAHDGGGVCMRRKMSFNELPFS